MGQALLSAILWRVVGVLFRVVRGGASGFVVIGMTGFCGARVCGKVWVV